MTNYKKVSELLQNRKISLIINRTSNEFEYDILKFQPYANLSYKSDRGFYCDDDEYIMKVKSFFQIALESQPALVITPEGSIPYEILREILDDKTQWPDMCKLWCLCMSGIDKTSFKVLTDTLSQMKQLSMFIEDESSINYRKHVNALFYLFRLSKTELAVVIQLKNRHMSDRGIDHEANDLSIGDTIYVFDLNNGEDTRNVMVTLICADAIQLSMSQLIQSLRGKHPLVVNSQCNSKPYDYRFVDNRSFIYCDHDVTKQRQIIVNWARGTNIDGKNEVDDSGNAYYNYLGVNGHSHLNSVCTDRDAFSNRMKNQIKGCTYFANEKVNIWKFPDKENLVKFYLKKEDVCGVDPSLSSSYDPVVKERYEFEETRWVLKDKYCIASDDKISKALRISDNENLRPIFLQRCCNKSCSDQCYWLYNDYFLGICLGGGLKNELECDREKSNRALSAMNNDSIDNTARKRELFSILVNLLEKNMIPEELKMFSNNIKFGIDCNAAECGSNNLYNVSVIHVPGEYPNWGQKKGIFAVIDTDQTTKVEKTYNELYESTNEEIRDQILLFYRENDQYVPFIKPHNSKKRSPSGNSFTKNATSIIYGGSYYEQD